VGQKRAAGPSWWWRVLSRFGELATSPQVAMATVLLLMIAVGTYYLPASDEAPTAALSPLDPDALEAERSEAPTATATSLPPTDETPEEEAVEEGSRRDGQPPAAPARERKRRARGARTGCRCRR